MASEHCKMSVGITAELYRPLHSSSTQFRLLRLLQLKTSCSQPSEPWWACVDIECTLTVETFDTAPKYDALSYEWGSEHPSVPITIHGKEYLIRPNLAYALASLRGSEERILWVDALCINQTDIRERNHQFRLMSDIYQHSRKVVVWLGRPGPGMNFYATEAVEMMERFGKYEPKTNLPPPPPDCHFPQESQFEEWIKLLRAGYESQYGCWQADWEAQSTQWSMMQEYRKRLRLRRQRLPEMITELLDSDLLPKYEPERLQDLLDIEHKKLEFLQSQYLKLQKELEEPQLRLLQIFKGRQRAAFKDAGFRLMGRLPEMPYSVEASGDEGQKHQNSRVLSRSSPAKHYDHIISDLGELQRFIFDKRQTLLEEERLQQSTGQQDLEETKIYLDQLRRVDENERRELKRFREQLASWFHLENKQTETLQWLLKSQDQSMDALMQEWNAARQGALHDFRPWRDSESKYHDELKALILDQKERLTSLERRHRNQWAECPPHQPDVDHFLTNNELEALASLRSKRRQIHAQLFKIRLTELQQREPAHRINQYSKWRDKLYRMARTMQSVDAEEFELRFRLIKTQTDWAQQWESLREKETERWQDCISAGNTSLTESFFGLASFCDLPYWSRLWIVQEVVLAEDLELCFGDDARTTRSWEVLTRARACLDRLPSSWKLHLSLDKPIRRIKPSLAFQLDRLREDCGRGSPLHRLLDITRNSLCQEQRDKIYGLLGITSDCQPGDIRMDFSKSSEDIYRDIIQWYHKAHGREEGYPSLVKFSEMVQLSFRCHCAPQIATDEGGISGISELPPSSFTETFCTKGIFMGSILPIDQIIDDTQLLALQQRDWIGVVLDYLDSSGVHKLRASLEQELIHLSSISTTFSIKETTLAYATENQPTVVPNAQEAPVISSIASVERREHEKSIFFLFGDGNFGITSTCIREGDVLCGFKDSCFGLVLRRRGDRYNLISRAILSCSSTSSSRPLASRRNTAVEWECLSAQQDQQAHEESAGPVFYVQLDAESLQQLTLPFETSKRHSSREFSYIHEADFGWYEFLTLGLNTSIEAPMYPSETDAVQKDNEEKPGKAVSQGTDKRDFGSFESIQAAVLEQLEKSPISWPPSEDSALSSDVGTRDIWNKCWPEWISWCSKVSREQEVELR